MFKNNSFHQAENQLNTAKRRCTMKKFTPFVSILLCIAMLIPAVSMAEKESDVIPSALQYLTDSDNYTDIASLLEAADLAITDGNDPQAVLEEMYMLADECDLLIPLMYLTENIAASGNEAYEKILSYSGGENTDHMLQLSRSGNEYLDTFTRAYDVPIVSEAMKEALSDSSAQFCFDPFFWPEAGFRNVFGKDFKSFKPSSPRAGYVCVVLKKGAEVLPGTAWAEDVSRDGYLLEAVEKTVSDMLSSLDADAPTLTGNPNLASSFWVFNVQYPFYALYGTTGEIKGYHCKYEVSAVDAKSKKAIAALSDMNRLGNTIYSWSNWIAQADTPDLCENSGYENFIEKIRSSLQNERTAASANMKITKINAEKVLNGILMDLASAEKDGWIKAVFEAGVRDVSFSGDEITFRVRSFSPDFASHGKYADAEDKAAWIVKVLSSVASYSTEITVPLEEGQISKAGMKALKDTVKKAASASKKDFGQKEFQKLLTDYLFPSPVAEKPAEADMIIQPTEDFFSFIDVHMDPFMTLTPFEWAPLFYGQSKQSVNVSEGPHNIRIDCAAIEPESLLKEAFTAFLDKQAWLDSADRITYGDAYAHAKAVAEAAIGKQNKANDKFTIYADIDELMQEKLPYSYKEYLKRYNYNEEAESFMEAFGKLPDMAAQPFPKSAVIFSPPQGTTVRVKVPGGMENAYVQICDYDSENVLATGYVEAGKMISFKIPQGDNYLVKICYGPYWYDTDTLFGELGTYLKTERYSVPSKSYYSTLTVQTVKGGNVGTTEIDPSDFKK